MKQDNRDCKIVQDLLPNYIEDLTNEITNQFIEEHIAKCPKCTQILKDMNGEIKLEQINQDKEIQYLKGIRKRVKRTIAIVSFVVIIIASCLVGYVYKKSQIQVNNYTFMRASYVMEDSKVAIDGNIYGTFIAVIDEHNKCISVRTIEEGYKEEELQARYQEMLNGDEKEKCAMNVKVSDAKLHYNINIWNDCTKEELKKKWIDVYKAHIIEEI